LRSLHKRARRLPDLPAEVLRDFDALVADFEAFVRSRAELANLAPAVRTKVAALGVQGIVSMRA
jgi:hypothetical protein